MNKVLPIQIALVENFFQQEKRLDFLVTASRKKHWALLLDLLVEFDRVCKKNDLTYFLDSGTLLGAVRHKGFIPWDDDIDVIMLRSDYEKLCRIATTEFIEPYFWQTNYTDPGSARRHGQLRNSQTTAILKDEMVGNRPLALFNQGMFLDVFILDEVPDNDDELRFFQQNLQKHINILWELKMLYNTYREPWIANALDQEMRIFDKEVTRYNNTGQSRVANISLSPMRSPATLFPKEFFSGAIDYPFEQYKFPCPKQANKILTGYYGNWEEPKKNSGWHGELFIDLENSYKKYLVNSIDLPTKHSLLSIIEQRNEAQEQSESVRCQCLKLDQQMHEMHELLVSEQNTTKQLMSELTRIKTSRIWKLISKLRII